MNTPLKYTDPSGCQYFRNYDALPFMDSGAGYAAGSAFYRADMISNYGYSAATAMMPHWSVSTRNPGTNHAHMNRRTFEGIYGEGAYDYQIAENAAENASNGNVSNDNELFRIYAYDANDNLIGIDIYYLTNKKNGFNGRMDDLMKDDGATGGGGLPELSAGTERGIGLGGSLWGGAATMTYADEVANGVSATSKGMAYLRVGGNTLGGLGFAATSYNNWVKIQNGTINTADYVDWGVSGGMLLTGVLISNPVGLTVLAVGGIGYSVYRLAAGDAADAWINENFGFRP